MILMITAWHRCPFDKTSLNLKRNNDMREYEGLGEEWVDCVAD